MVAKIKAVTPPMVSPPRQINRKKWRLWIYPAALLLLVLTWFTYMSLSRNWALYQTYWPMALTMTLGSFVAGSTPQGGAAIAFPVFTKLLHIPVEDSRTFGLMIQTIGMGMASLLILTRKVKVLPQVVAWGTAGAFLGMMLGTFVINIPNPYPRLLFTLAQASFAVALIISRWVLRWQPRRELPGWQWSHRLLFFGFGAFGGTFAAYTGSGVDMITFVVLTLAFGMDEKISIPTTVIIMALLSVFGFFLHGVVVQDIGIVWGYWLVAVPVVAMGAPLGVFVTTKVPRDWIIWFILFLVTAETITTVILIPFTNAMVLVTILVVVAFVISFAGMLYYRQTRVPRQELPELEVAASEPGSPTAVTPTTTD